MNWAHLWIVVIAFVAMVSGCQKQTPIEESGQSTLSPSTQNISMQAPAAEESTVEKEASSQAVADSENEGSVVDEKTSEPPSSAPSPSSPVVEKPLSEPPSIDSEEVETAESFSTKTTQEKWELTLRMSGYLACVAAIEPDAFLRTKLQNELFEWFQVSMEEVNQHTERLLKSDVAFVQAFTDGRKVCAESFVDFLIQRDKACFAYCERLQQCGGIGRTGCISRCEAWRSVPEIFRQFSCIKHSECSEVTRCVKSAMKRSEWRKNADVMRRKNQELNPDPERKRLLNAISALVCAPPEVRVKPSRLVALLEKNGFNKASYTKAVKRLESDPSFAGDLYDRTRGCTPLETAPQWPERRNKKKTNTKASSTSP